MRRKRATPDPALHQSLEVSAVDIEIPNPLINRLLRHPALRAHGPSRAKWQLLESDQVVGRQRRLSTAEAALSITLIQGSLQAGPLEQGFARLMIEGSGAAALGGALAASLPLLPATTSLEEAALLLAGGRKPASPGLAGQTSTAPALALALREGLAGLMRHAPQCRADAPPLGVHQSRVAIRRMRSVLKMFFPAVMPHMPPGALGGFDARLKAMATALGPARDLDVFLGGMALRLQSALPDDKRLRPLMAAARRARLDAYKPLPALLTGTEFRATIWMGFGLIEALEAVPPQDDLAGFAAQVLARRHRRLKRAGAMIEQLPPAELHALRLDAKRLRYAAELLVPLWPSHHARRYLRRLMALQEALGLANDAEVARGLVRGLRITGWTLGVAEGFALAGAAGSRDMALEAWAGWRAAKRFWQDG